MDGGGFGGVVDLGAGAMGADVADVFERAGTFGCGVGVCDGLAHGAGCAMREWLSNVAGVGGEAEADDFGVDLRVASLCGGEGFEREHGGAFAEGHADAVGGEGTALGGGDDAHRVPRAEEAEGERSLVAAGDGCRDHATADHLKGETDGVGSRGAGGGDIESGAGDFLIDGDVAGTGRGHGADDSEGMDAGVAGVELDGLGLFGLSATAGAADDDGDFFRRMVAGQLRFGSGLAGGDDGELGGAVGGGDDAGVEVSAGVEVFDGGGLGEAEALRLVMSFATGSFGIGREGSDAGGASEEGGAEVCYGVADGSDASQASDDDSIQCCSPW